jgi:hypothetical protein
VPTAGKSETGDITKDGKEDAAQTMYFRESKLATVWKRGPESYQSNEPSMPKRVETGDVDDGKPTSTTTTERMWNLYFYIAKRF